MNHKKTQNNHKDLQSNLQQTQQQSLYGGREHASDLHSVTTSHTHEGHFFSFLIQSIRELKDELRTPKCPGDGRVTPGPLHQAVLVEGGGAQA